MHHLHRPPRFTKHKTYLLDTCTFFLSSLQHLLNLLNNFHSLLFFATCWKISERWKKFIREKNPHRGLGYTYEDSCCWFQQNNAKPHIPRTTIDVKIWVDHNSCCPDTKDYQVCKDIGCADATKPYGIEPVNDPWTKLQIGYNYKVIGTTYTATCDNKPNSQPCGSSNSRRRQLLQDEYGNSGERL